MDLFWKASRAVGPLLFEVEDLETHVVEQRVVGQPFALIGRDPSADLCLSGDDVSRRHAYLQVVNGRVYCLDLGTRTGTWWHNGPRRSDWLDPGNSVRIGGYQIRLGLGSPTGADTPAADFRIDLSASPELSEAQLLGSLDFELEICDGESRTTWRMDRALAIVGSKVGCRVRLSEHSVAAVHFSLVRTSLGVWAVDLLRRDMLTINGSLVRVGLLEDGDELLAGRAAIVVRNRCDARDSLGLPRPATSLGLPALTSGRTTAGSMLGIRPEGGPSAPQEAWFDQLQQAVAAASQMFGMFHREQKGALRDELAQLQELGRQLRSLRAEMAALLDSRPQKDPQPQPEQASLTWASRTVESPALNGSVADPPEPPGNETLLQIQDRLSKVREEGQTRWQKVLGLLTAPLRDEFMP